MNIRQLTARHPVWTSLAFMAVVFGLLWLLVGCSDKGSSYSEENGAEAVASEEKVTPPPVDELRHLFGDIHQYDDGIIVFVSEPKEFELSETAEVEGTERALSVVFQIEITNNSTEEFQPAAFPKVTTGEFEASMIKDVNNPFGDFRFQSGLALQPGETETWLIGYSVDSLDDLTVKVSPSFDHEEARFTNILP